MVGTCPVCSSKMNHYDTIGYVCKVCGHLSSGSLKRKVIPDTELHNKRV